MNMMVAPKAKGLFQKAISESGLPGCVVSHNVAKLNTDLFLNKMNLSQDEIYKLKTMSAKDMKNAAAWVVNNICRYYPRSYLPGPVLDDLLPTLPTHAVCQGSAAGIALIIGTNKDDATMFVKKIKHWLPNSWKQIDDMLKLNHCEDKLNVLHTLYQSLPEKDQMAALANIVHFLLTPLK